MHVPFLMTYPFEHDKHTEADTQDLHSEGHEIHVLFDKQDVELHSVKHWLMALELQALQLPPHC